MTIKDQLLYASPEQASQALISYMLGIMARKPERIFSVALSGGSTPAVLFGVWEREYASVTPWERIRFYWVDERCVPPDDGQSNFALARHLLFDKVGGVSLHYRRIRGETPPGEAAGEYASLVKAALPVTDGVPRFDFVLLGIGEDGHTSSVFPDRMDLLRAEEPYAVAVNPYNRSVRICMTGRPMVEAGHTCFLATGKDKHGILERILDKEGADVYPASYVWHHAHNPRLYAS